MHSLARCPVGAEVSSCESLINHFLSDFLKDSVSVMGITLTELLISVVSHICDVKENDNIWDKVGVTNCRK